MRTYQYIQTRYWEAESLQGLSVDAIAVDLYLLTNSSSGLTGAQAAVPAQISEYLNITVKRAEAALHELEGAGRLVRAPRFWVLPVGKWEYEPSKSSKVLIRLHNELITFPKAIQQAFFKIYPEMHNTLSDTLSDTLFPIEVEVEVERSNKSSKKDAAKRRGGCPAVGLWIDIHRKKKLYTEKEKPPGKEIKYISKAFKHLDSDIKEFEKRVRNFLSDPWVLKTRPGAKYFHDNLPKFIKRHPDAKRSAKSVG